MHLDAELMSMETRTHNTQVNDPFRVQVPWYEFCPAESGHRIFVTTFRPKGSAKIMAWEKKEMGQKLLLAPDQETVPKNSTSSDPKVTSPFWPFVRIGEPFMVTDL